MKSLLGLVLFPVSVLASVDYDIVSQVRSFSEEDDHVVVTLLDDSRVFRPSKTSSVVPCLRNGWQAQMPVGLNLEKGSGIIVDCRLVPKQHPGKSDAR